MLPAHQALGSFDRGHHRQLSSGLMESAGGYTMFGSHGGIPILKRYFFLSHGCFTHPNSPFVKASMSKYFRATKISHGNEGVRVLGHRELC